MMTWRPGRRLTARCWPGDASKPRLAGSDAEGDRDKPLRGFCPICPPSPRRQAGHPGRLSLLSPLSPWLAIAARRVAVACQPAPRDLA